MSVATETTAVPAETPALAPPVEYAETITTEETTTTAAADADAPAPAGGLAPPGHELRKVDTSASEISVNSLRELKPKREKDWREAFSPAEDEELVESRSCPPLLLHTFRAADHAPLRLQTLRIIACRSGPSLPRWP